jgi:1,4-dihydroxy-2-naphthoate polyprenyltransferase
MTWRLLIRALRLPFLTVSILPYVFGAVAAETFHAGFFLLGLVSVSAAHLSANLANDYGDAQSGADDKDPTYYGYFGGSKLIQDGRLSKEFYRKGSAYFALVSVLSGGIALLMRDSPHLMLVLAASLFLGLAYTLPPFRLGYRKLGEVVVFLLFGPACVMAGATLQKASILNSTFWLLSVPFGLLATAVLVANEVPDVRTDAEAGKQTLIVALGARRGFIAFLLLALGAFGTVAVGVAMDLLPLSALAVCLTIPLVLRATRTLREEYDCKPRLPLASRLAIGAHFFSALALIVSVAV